MKPTLIVITALAATLAARHRSAALRHWILAVGVTCAVVVPIMERALPSWSLVPVTTSFIERPAGDVRAETPRPPSPAPRKTTTAATATASQNAGGFLQTLTARELVVAGWISGSAVSLFMLAIGLARLLWLARKARRIEAGGLRQLTNQLATQCGLRRPVLLLQSEHPSLLVTWGAARPKIILPAPAASWSDDLASVVLCHELAHIRRGDWIVQLIAELLRSIYWFNPLMGIACRRLRLESEHACDDAVLNRGVAGSAYATHLLDLARAFNQRRVWVPAVAMARPSSLQRRVRAMLNIRTDRHPISPLARLTVAVLVCAATVAVAGAQAFATLSGTLVDPSGGVLPGVTVKLANAERQAKYELQSNRSGQFEFVGLLPGSYELEAQIPGFKTYRASVTMAAEQIDRRIAMEIGKLEESITIRDGAPAAPAARAAASAVAPRPNPPCRAEPVGGTTRIGGNIRPPHKIKDVKPAYPASLSGTGAEATVIIDGKIGVEGFIKDIQVRDGADATFVSAVIAAVNQWQFDSTLLNCVPVEPSITITARFVGSASHIE